ncbi:hypothetical protein HDU93_002504 [Gonapodya sp. JEL0774]|nr:hypothetical protein HDU93_002504 [Gonapodya sp. JEL0774]
MASNSTTETDTAQMRAARAAGGAIQVPTLAAPSIRSPQSPRSPLLTPTQSTQPTNIALPTFADINARNSLDSAFSTFFSSHAQLLPVYSPNPVTGEKEFTSHLTPLTLLAHSAIHPAFSSLRDALEESAGVGAALDLSFPHTLPNLHAHLHASLLSHFQPPHTVSSCLDATMLAESTSTAFTVLAPESSLEELASVMKREPYAGVVRVDGEVAAAAGMGTRTEEISATVTGPNHAPHSHILIPPSHLVAYLAAHRSALPRRIAAIKVRDAVRRARRARGRAASVSLSMSMSASSAEWDAREIDGSGGAASSNGGVSPLLRPVGSAEDVAASGFGLGNENGNGNGIEIGERENRVVQLVPEGVCAAAGLEELIESHHPSAPVVDPTGTFLGTLHPALITSHVAPNTSTGFATSIADALVKTAGDLVAGSGSARERERDTCRADEVVWDCAERFVQVAGRGGSLWIVDASNRPVGHISAVDVIEAVLGGGAGPAGRDMWWAGHEMEGIVM